PAALQSHRVLVRRLYDERQRLLANPDPDGELSQGVLTQKKRGPDSRGAPGRGPDYRDRPGCIGGDRVPALGVAIASPARLRASPIWRVTRAVPRIPAKDSHFFLSPGAARLEIITG